MIDDYTGSMAEKFDAERDDLCPWDRCIDCGADEAGDNLLYVEADGGKLCNECREAAQRAVV